MTKSRYLVVLLLVPYGVLVVLDPNAATAVAAGLALIGAAWTLGHADATARRTRTGEYRARWDHPEFFEARSTASDFFNAHGQEEERWKEWKGWIEHGRATSKRLHIIAVLNFWEEVASAYNQNLLDNDWFRTDLAWQLDYNWERVKWFVRKFRCEQENTAFWCEWQVAVKAVKPDLARQEEDGRRRAEAALENGEDLLSVSQPTVGR
jgi:hypothetical protein